MTLWAIKYIVRIHFILTTLKASHHSLVVPLQVAQNDRLFYWIDLSWAKPDGFLYKLIGHIKINFHSKPKYQIYQNIKEEIILQTMRSYDKYSLANCKHRIYKWSSMTLNNRTFNIRNCRKVNKCKKMHTFILRSTPYKYLTTNNITVKDKLTNLFVFKVDNHWCWVFL